MSARDLIVRPGLDSGRGLIWSVIQILPWIIDFRYIFEFLMSSVFSNNKKWFARCFFFVLTLAWLGFFVPLAIFSRLCGDVWHSTYTRYSWPLNSEDSLAVTRDIGLYGHLRARDIHTCCRAFNSGIVVTRFNDVGRVQNSYSQPAAHDAKTLTECVFYFQKKSTLY